MLYQLSYAHHITNLSQRYQMVHPAGLEPATIRLEGGCSIQLSYGRLSICKQTSSFRHPHKRLLLSSLLVCRLTQRLAVLDKRGEC